ncbi:MAG: hypothetical protein UU58_C0001G0006 [Candidatus Nomurabacteria bacterium GW2011_GWA2_41_25]|uniref:HEPN AbiU2-like domain-containing protein n=1 Tax=Candidatus Nomurabacteria bacterium GW2011_GWA2_41_25 TaxID=1618736 RepID=A0A0G0Y6U6_9BACT|nr:MAG: hypothetical protein UU58_C0001G0006 [Candidatus Nomurabacteria bacterium GW2011_GWA2_41_25]OGI66941.1 MAG: hypothetical protein A2823_02465 [Candidatus Nomurabacteria bacterium RIFCSPHIGHO2_01_FULL_41_91]OGI80421.1 MAG: hypothetical protein A3D43_00085 [Candidatus Nomurabacteria bacterium RIFCSPHIGHO2_02_FULL_41_52]OGI94045.1 MAG: hypothetical protein A3A07_01890 [Candidatus Nomurabacteria bacterium RIFCSPLOWO2_01_FULL_41_52]
MKEIDLNKIYIARLVNRIMQTSSVFVLWKSVKSSLNEKDAGQEKVSENKKIMDCYDGGNIFSTILFSLETTLVIELYKFFDTTKKALKLVEINNSNFGVAESLMSEEDKIHLKEILKKNKNTIDQIGKLRKKLFGHDQKEDNEQFLLPSMDDMNNLFSAIQEIHNLISLRVSQDFYAFDDKEYDQVKFVFQQLLDDLDMGKTERIKKEDEE